MLYSPLSLKIPVYAPFTHLLTQYTHKLTITKIGLSTFYNSDPKCTKQNLPTMHKHSSDPTEGMRDIKRTRLWFVKWRGSGGSSSSFRTLNPQPVDLRRFIIRCADPYPPRPPSATPHRYVIVSHPTPTPSR